jgi:Immunity protein 44
MGITLWMSGEVQLDIAEEHRSARKDVEAAVNVVLESSNYGDGLGKWYLIEIILENDIPGFDEVNKYRKKERSFESRLKISHSEFKSADSVGQRKLIVEALLRSIAEMRLAIRGIDCAKLESDIRELAVAKGWI